MNWIVYTSKMTMIIGSYYLLISSLLHLFKLSSGVIATEIAALRWDNDELNFSC